MKTTEELLIEANDLLRSCNAIIERQGKNTNWDGIHKKIKAALKEQFALPEGRDLRSEITKWMK